MTKKHAQQALLRQEIREGSKKVIEDELNVERALKPYPLLNAPALVSYIEVEHALHLTVQNMLTGFVFQDIESSQILSFMMGVRVVGSVMQARFQFYDNSLEYRPTVGDIKWVKVDIDARPRADDYEKLSFSIRVINSPNDTLISFMEKELPHVHQIRMIPRPRTVLIEEENENAALNMYTPTVVENVCGDNNDMTSCDDSNCSQRVCENNDESNVITAGPNGLDTALKTEPRPCSEEWNDSEFLTSGDGVLIGDLRPVKPMEEIVEGNEDSCDCDEADEKEVIVDEKERIDPETGDKIITETVIVKENGEVVEKDKVLVEETVNGDIIDVKIDMVVDEKIRYTKQSIANLNYKCQRLPMVFGSVVCPQIVKVYGENDVKPKGTRPAIKAFPWTVEDVIFALEEGSIPSRLVTLVCRPMWWYKSSDKAILEQRRSTIETRLSLIHQTHPDHSTYTTALANNNQRMSELYVEEYLRLTYSTLHDYSRSVMPLHRGKNTRLTNLLSTRHVDIQNGAMFAFLVTFRERNESEWDITDFKTAHQEMGLAEQQALAEMSEMTTYHLNHEFHRTQDLRIRNDQASTIC